MSDNLTKEQRSMTMSRIKSKNTSPELIVRKFLFSNGFRYRLHDKNIIGSPDIVLKRYNTLIFVNGCFWHGHSKLDDKCKIKFPTEKEFWIKKITNNQERDKRNLSELKKLGWKIIIIWECSLKKNIVAKTLENLKNEITS